MRFRLNDDEYVTRLRRLQGTKRVGAIFMITLGLLVCVGLIPLLLNHRERARAAFDEVQAGLTLTTAQLSQAVDAGRRSTEFTTGFSVGAWLAIGGFLVAGGLVVLINGRRDRLLIEHYRANQRVT